MENEMDDKDYKMMMRMAKSVTKFVNKNDDDTYDITTPLGIYKMRILTHAESKALERASEQLKKDSMDFEIRKSLVEPKLSDNEYGKLLRPVTLRLEVAYMHLNGMLDFL